MDLTYCKRDCCIHDLLQQVLKYGERMTKEAPLSLFEMEGRLMTMFGVVCKAAGDLYALEKEARATLLVTKGFDDHRQIASFKALNEGLKGLLCSVPLFHYRDYQNYPIVTFDQIMQVREELQKMEELPFCGNGMVKKTNFDATALAYKMYDMIFLGMEGIIKLLQSMYDDHQMLQANPEMRVHRWQRMMNNYQKKDWENDKQRFQKRIDEHIRYHGSDKTSLTTLLNQLDFEATQTRGWTLSGETVFLLNHLYLNQDGHITYIFDHRHSLTQEQITSHLRYIHCRKLLEQEIELYDLRQPALGAYADLFTNRAAQKMATLLAPVIAKHVDFEHGYQYGAWVKAMMDLKLIRADKRNGTAITRFVNKTFSEQIDKTTLFRCLSKENDFEKIRDLYKSIMSVVRQEIEREPRLYVLNKAL